MEKKEFTLPTFQEPDSNSLFLASRHGLRTYKELSQYAAFFLARLQEFDIDLSKPVGFLVESCDELVLAIASCWKLGIPFACFDPHATKTELQEFPVLDPQRPFRYKSLRWKKRMTVAGSHQPAHLRGKPIPMMCLATFLRPAPLLLPR